MNLFVNRKAVETADGSTLAGVLAELGIPADGTAAALNNRVVPRAEWADTPLAEGDRITVISAVCGG